MTQTNIMIFPRPTKVVPPSSILTSIKPNMKIRKFSIPSSFLSICWFSSLFAICLFSFLYLHPRDTDNCINNIIKINNESEKTLTVSNKYVSNVTDNDGVTSLVNVHSSTPTLNAPSLVTLTAAESNDTIIELSAPKASELTIVEVVDQILSSAIEDTPPPAVDDTPPPAIEDTPSPAIEDTPSPAIEDTPSVIKETPPAIEDTPPPAVEDTPPPAVEDTPSAIEETPSAIKETPPAIEDTPSVIKETPPAIEETPSAIKETPPVVEETPPAIKEETDEEYNTIPSYDVFSNPPWNCTREERILWLKEKLEESKLVKSTSRTQNFEAKIQSFFNKQGNNIIPCRVRIFLTWTYPANLFGNRELLVLESIIKAHYDGCVVILSKTMDTKHGWSILKPILDRGHRVLPVNPDYHYLFSNTPAQGWLERLESGDIDPGTVPITINLSNILRLAVLYKYGGVYFDNDMIILKPVSELRNTIGIQFADHHTGTWSAMSNAVLIFDKEHPLLWKFMEEFAWNFDGFKWGFNGPDLATRVVAKALNDSNFEFHIMVPLAFYPVDWVRVNRLFGKPHKKGSTWAQDKFREISSESYGVHLWSRQTRNLKIEEKSTIDRLISSHCIVCQNVYDS